MMHDFNADFNATSEEIDAAHRRRLEIRAELRRHNGKRPRCAGCGQDMVLYEAEDIVTEEQMAQPGYDWLMRLDFRPGDIICFWCTVEIADIGRQFVWGRA